MCKSSQIQEATFYHFYSFFIITILGVILVCFVSFFAGITLVCIIFFTVHPQRKEKPVTSKGKHCREKGFGY